jgi:superfamily II DNA or RNA helicase
MLLARRLPNRWVLTRTDTRTITTCLPAFKPSPAQAAILNAMKTHNIIVSARPGSGKTAIAQGAAIENPDKAIGVSTFSKNLQVENSHRMRPYPWAKPFTFHG